MNVVTFYSREVNPEQIFEVVVHAPENVGEVKAELEEHSFELSRDAVLGHFAIKIATEQWPEVNKIIQGEIIIGGQQKKTN